jgi:hypothetical protein
MSNILFDEEQQKQLRANHWVKSVTEKSISFTEDFKVYFINEYNLGKLPKQIFKDAGFDINMLGDKRIEQCTARYKRQNKRIEGFHDTRANNLGRRVGKELSIEEENELLKKQNAKLQQELEFLKKMEFLARQAKKSKQ